jgi:hypothetical protein
MSAVSPFEVVYKIKKTPIVWPTAAAWAVVCSLPWATPVGLTAVRLDLNRRGPRRSPWSRCLVVKADKFRNDPITFQNE